MPKSNEITAFRPLLAGLELARTVVTADALHGQRDHAHFLAMSSTPPTCYSSSRTSRISTASSRPYPGARYRSATTPAAGAHSREEIRRLQIFTTPGLLFPHAVQALRITRRTKPIGARRWTTITVHALTNLTAYQASPAHLADHIRGHWRIEALHHIRDLTYGEGASQIRTGTAPEPWPHYVTSPSASSNTTARPTSPKPYAATPLCQAQVRQDMELNC